MKYDFQESIKDGPLPWNCFIETNYTTFAQHIVTHNEFFKCQVLMKNKKKKSEGLLLNR